MSTVDFSLTRRALAIFREKGLDPRQYVTAYGGESAGLDLYNMGQEKSITGRTKWSVFGEEPVFISTGLRVVIPKGYVGLIRERGSVAKLGLTYRGGVIDNGYTGEIFLHVVNLGEKDTTIPIGAKLPFQLVVVKCSNNFNLISDLDFVEKTKNSVRQENSLGSTN